VYDVNSNPTNLLGLYSLGNDIRITTAAPSDLDIHAVMMAGNPSDGYNSSVNVQSYDACVPPATGTPCPRGNVNLIGGIIEEYYGAFGTFDANGLGRTGYGRAFRYDRRMGRGFSPPYFPTINVFDLVAQQLAGARPAWRETAP
jgi:hypothetical protein